MGFLKSLFKSETSNVPEDYQKIYFRWKIDGKEYGPLLFEDMITREKHWSGPPLQGRFENETTWRKYNYFVKTLNQLKPSNKQLKILDTAILLGLWSLVSR